MKKTFKYRIYPDEQQIEYFKNVFGCIRYVYNNVLTWRKEQYEQHNKKINYYDASKYLTYLKTLDDLSFLKEVDRVPLVQGLRHQERAYINFFQKRAQFPNYKAKNNLQALNLTKASFKFKNNQLLIRRCDNPIKIRWTQSLSSPPSSLTIVKFPSGKYFINFVCDYEPSKLKPAQKEIGLAFGINYLVVTDDNVIYNNLQITNKYADRLAIAQQSFQLKENGSNNREKARIKIARIYEKIKNSRADNIHKISRAIINTNGTIYVKDLRVTPLIEATDSIDEHRDMYDCSFNELLRQLEYKCKWGGRKLIKIPNDIDSVKNCLYHTINKMIITAINSKTAGQVGIAYLKK